MVIGAVRRTARMVRGAAAGVTGAGCCVRAREGTTVRLSASAIRRRMKGSGWVHCEDDDDRCMTRERRRRLKYQHNLLSPVRAVCAGTQHGEEWVGGVP